MQTTLALPPKQPKLSQSKRQSQSGSLAYGKISDNDHNSHGGFDLFSDDNKIRVIARFRPKNKKEVRWAKQFNIDDVPPEFISSQQVKLEPSPLSSGSKLSIDLSSVNSNSNNYGGRAYISTLDHVLDEHCTQRQVFYRCGLPMIMACLDGYNSTIFAYGQSGSGKTYTMMGPENNVKCADEFGLVPRCIIYLFQKLDERLSQNGGKLQDYIVNMELLQIYKTQLLDLLNPESKKKLVIKTNFSTDGVFIQNLKSVQIQTVEESFKLLTNAQQHRIVAGHSLNEVSSRSHMLITMTVIQRCVDGTLKTSKLNFGDLAGSEDLTKASSGISGMNDIRKKEAIAINQSLSALTTAVSYLSRGQKPSFRDSPLTHILKDSLGGNSKTIMLVTVSPHIYNRGETIRTLRFASTAKKVKNKAKINEQKSIVQLKKRIKELERENSKFRQQVIILKKNNKKQLEILEKRHKNNETMLNIEIKQDDQDSVIMYDDDDDENDHDSDEKTLENKFKKKQERKNSLNDDSHDNDESDEIIEMDDEWGSDSECDEMVNHLEDHLKDRNNSSDEEDNESDLELNEYINQLNEYREKLDRECEENLELQTKIDEKNLELECCNNKIAQLVDELNQNENDFYDSKSKIRHLHNLLQQYQTTFPLFKPLEMNISSRARSNTPSGSGNYDDYDIVHDNNGTSVSVANLHQHSLSNLSFRNNNNNNNNNDTASNLLENLLSLHQKMESQMKETEYALNEIRRVTITTDHELNNLYENKEADIQLSDVKNDNNHKESDTLVVNKNSLAYESADEKLDEWDLDVSGSIKQLNNDGEDNNNNNNNNKKHSIETSDHETEVEEDDHHSEGEKMTTKHLREHLRNLSKNEKKLKNELAVKLKQEAKKKSNWCQCFWSKPKESDIDKEANTGKLIEEYLKIQMRKDLVKDKYQRKKEKDRAKALKKQKKRKNDKKSIK